MQKGCKSVVDFDALYFESDGKLVVEYDDF